MARIKSATALALTLPPKANVRRHRITLEFDSARDAKSFKEQWQQMFRKHEMGFPGTLVFMSHELVEPK